MAEGKALVMAEAKMAEEACSKDGLVGSYDGGGNSVLANFLADV